MDAARRGKWIGFLCLGVTAFGWALNWPLMKLLLQQWPPLFARGLAGVAAALILFSIAKARGQPLEVPREAIPRLLFASFTNVFAWMGFSTVAMKFVPVGEGALIVYTMPIWATLLAWPLAGIRPKLVPLIGVISAALILGEPLCGGDGTHARRRDAGVAEGVMGGSRAGQQPLQMPRTITFNLACSDSQREGGGEKTNAIPNFKRSSSRFGGGAGKGWARSTIARLSSSSARWPALSVSQ
jgi:hypothetical protein